MPPSTINQSPSTELASRLITLPDGRPGLRSSISVEIRDPGKDDVPSVPDQPVLDFISSDATLDRYNEIISPAGWRLGNYLRNPVFQNAHQYGDILHTLGKATVTEVRNGKLFQRIEFACDINPMAKIAYGLYRGKFLNAVSVGFVPVRWENGTDKTPYTRKFIEQELLELSAVAIPANPNALALGLKSGAIEKSDLSDVLDLFRSTLESSQIINHQLARFAFLLHTILKS
ncbi:MAG TPA: HK97 family phage prohead protease [Candidatus Dormibacteraeota bacterium]|nr:HK97 family phage prohead protease [Candidatus Dormibacteraeota bacterium]